MSKAAIGDFPRVSHSQPASMLSGKERRISGERQTDSALEATKTIQNMCKTTAAKQASKDTRWRVDRKKRISKAAEFSGKREKKMLNSQRHLWSNILGN